MKKQVEILAPAGSMEAVVAAVRTGANAVYLGAKSLNARQGAKNFEAADLLAAVRYCHARGVSVHMTLNTVVFDSEYAALEQTLREAAMAGVDALIVQDFGALRMARYATPHIALHASTQMAVHNLWGVEQLASMGVSRVVLARELSLPEIITICKESPLEIETFIHGALCSSVSGQCYMSSLIGGRSGNRGRCAQTCRLPFASGGSTHALSLKDLSVIEHIPALRQAGVASFKIEGRLKRPEYVAATVTACRTVLEGGEPDYQTLRAVFSRSGFTQGYLGDDNSEEMYGTRTKDDVTAAAGTLGKLATLYAKEQPLVAVEFAFSMQAGKPVCLTATVGATTITVEGEKPQVAVSAPTTAEKVEAALGKTGGTPFYAAQVQCELQSGYMVPVSGLNFLRRTALEQLLTKLEVPRPKLFREYPAQSYPTACPAKTIWRVRVETWEQALLFLEEPFVQLIVPLDLAAAYWEKLKRLDVLVELPRIAFALPLQRKIERQLQLLQEQGCAKVVVGGIGAFGLAQQLGLETHGDFTLNITNQLALEEWAQQGLATATMSVEYMVEQPLRQSAIPKGVLVYGSVPAMVFRSHPAGMKEEEGYLTDRLGKKFRIKRYWKDTTVLYNTVPLYMGDKLARLSGMDFYTLYFTGEAAKECWRIWQLAQAGMPEEGDYTRGLYQKRIQ